MGLFLTLFKGFFTPLDITLVCSLPQVKAVRHLRLATLSLVEAGFHLKIYKILIRISNGVNLLSSGWKR